MHLWCNVSHRVRGPEQVGLPPPQSSENQGVDLVLERHTTAWPPWSRTKDTRPLFHVKLPNQATTSPAQDAIGRALRNANAQMLSAPTVPVNQICKATILGWLALGVGAATLSQCVGTFLRSSPGWAVPAATMVAALCVGKAQAQHAFDAQRIELDLLKVLKLDETCHSANPQALNQELLGQALRIRHNMRNDPPQVQSLVRLIYENLLEVAYRRRDNARTRLFPGAITARNDLEKAYRRGKDDEQLRVWAQEGVSQ